MITSSINLTRMTVVLVGLIHAIYMNLVLSAILSYLLRLLCISWISFYFNPHFGHSK